MSETSPGIEFLKGFNPFKKETPQSFVVENKQGVSGERVKRFSDAYTRLEHAGAVGMMQEFIRAHSRPQNKPFAGLELIKRDDGVTGDGYYVFFDREDVKVPAASGAREGLNTQTTKEGPVLKNQQTAKGVKVVHFTDGASDVYAYMGNTKDEEGKVVEVGGRWERIVSKLPDTQKILEAAAISTPYFITESKNTCIIKNPAPEDTASQNPSDKVTLKP